MNDIPINTTPFYCPEICNALFDDELLLVAILDHELKFVRVNSAYAAADCKQPDFFIGKKHFDLFPNTENERIFRNSLATGELVNHRAKTFEYSENPERGTTYWDWRLTPIKNKENISTHLLLCLLNVTDKIRLVEELIVRERDVKHTNIALRMSLHERQHALDSSKELASTIFSTVDALIMVMDNTGKITGFNSACCKVTGYTEAQAVSRRPWDFLMVPSEASFLRELFRSLRADRFPVQDQSYCQTKTDNPRLIYWSYSCVTDSKNVVKYVVATGLDMTDKAALERALQLKQEELRLLVENIDDIFWIFSADLLTLHYVSPAFEPLFGIPLSSIYRAPLDYSSLIYPDEHISVFAELHAYKFGPLKRYYDAEYRIIRRDNSTRWIKTRFWPVHDKTGNLYRFAGTTTDITERKIAEETHLHTERAHRNALVREIHHRVKNSLQGIIGLLRQHSQKAPQAREAIAAAITQVSSIAAVHGLQGTNKEENIYLCDLCTAIADSISGVMNEKMRPKILVSRPNIKPVKLRQHESVPIALILNELIFNSMKHTPSFITEPVSIVIDALDNAIHVTITNTGISLPEGFDLDSGINIGTGLTLAKILLPEHSVLTIVSKNNATIATLKLTPDVFEFG